MKDDKDKIVIDNSPKQLEEPQIALDDKKRIRVLSPGMLVFRRFIRSKLALIGSLILIFMFCFTFLGGFLSPYGEREVFHKFDMMESEYAMAVLRTEFINLPIDGVEVHYSVAAMLNSYIYSFTEGQTEREINDTYGNQYILYKLGNSCYLLKQVDYTGVASYTTMGATFEFSEILYDNNDFRNLILNAISSNNLQFNYEEDSFKLVKSGKSYNVFRLEEPIDAIYTSTLVFDSFTDEVASKEFKIAAFKSLYNTKSFTYDGVDYIIEGNEDLYTIYSIDNEEQTEYMNMSHFVVRRYNGEDSLSIHYKENLQLFIANMESEGLVSAKYTYSLPVIDELTGNVTYEEQNYVIVRSNDNFVIKNQQLRYLIDIYASPSFAHWFGTDSNGMDVLTRMMRGGRISLMIGFIVVIIELFIGVIFGGIAGFFGKWIDNLIMRLVDIFNCIPFLPIMIIIGAVFDKLQMDSYTRIMWLMIVMGVLGWPGIARLVRGQILSLREQEFMIAAEATGISTRRRIFRHLIPNVMPQLIVTATMGLGGIILTESTLSFLGLGAKYPMATWGAMINSVSNASDLVRYTFIWIPVGLLICLTVIAFNFVGDGLRDAFDPKMKR